MSRYVINVLASQDLNEIADYFAETNLEAGEKFFRAFNRKCQQLVAFPNIGKSYATIRPGLKGAIVGRLHYFLQNSGRWHRNPQSSERSP